MVIGRAKLKDGSGESLMLGVTNENLRRLVGGEPILLRRETHGDGIPEGWEIVIFFGRTEQEIYADLKRMGAIGQDTKIHRDPRL